MHVHAVDDGAARAVRVVLGGVRGDGHAGRVPGRADELGGPHGRARRGVHLVRVVQLDELDGLEVPRRLRGERRGQHRADREVRGDQHAHPRVLSQLRLEALAALGHPARRADDRVQPVLHGEGHVLGRGVRDREVQDVGGAGVEHRVQAVLRAELGHELQPLGRSHRGHRVAAHAATGAQDRDARDVVGSGHGGGGAGLGHGLQPTRPAPAAVAEVRPGRRRRAPGPPRPGARPRPGPGRRRPRGPGRGRPPGPRTPP